MANGDPLKQFMDDLPAPGPSSPSVVSPGGRVVVGGFRRSASRNMSIEQKQRLARQRAEKEAIESFCAELSLDPCLGQENAFDMATQHQLVSMSVPTSRHVMEREREIAASTDLAARAAPIPEEQVENDDDDDDDDDDEEQSYLMQACKCYRGTAVPSDELAAMSQREKFDKLRFLVSGDQQDGLWLRPPNATSMHKPNEYHLEDDAYGTRRDLTEDVKSAAHEFTRARRASATALTLLMGNTLVRIAFSDVQHGLPKRVYGIEDGAHKIQLVLDHAAGEVPFEVTQQFKDQANMLRAAITTRMRHLKEGKRINDCVQSEMARFRATIPTDAEVADGGVLTLRSTFTTDDLMKTVVEHFGPYDAGRLLRTCKWGDDITKLLKDRFPHLHIYKIPGLFPHHVDAGGTGYMHAQTLFKVAVGLVYSKKREPRPDGTIEQDPGEADRPGVQCFDAPNTPIGVPNRAVWTGYDQPWDPDTKHVTIHPSMFFVSHPELKISIVDAVTGRLIVDLGDRELHGGLVPEKAMASLEAKGKRSRLMWNHSSENPTWASMRNENFATMSKFKGDSLLTSRIGCKVRIRAEAVGIGRHGSQLTLKTESEPLSVVSSLKVAKNASYSGKRKKR